MEPVTITFETFAGGRAPSKVYDADSCWDVYSAARFPIWIPSQHVRLVPLGIRVALPPGWGLQLRPRSGLSTRGVIVTPGTIDQGYRGEIHATVHNISPQEFVVKQGDRIAQLFLEQVHPAVWVEDRVVVDTERGKAGHGSTGV